MKMIGARKAPIWGWTRSHRPISTILGCGSCATVAVAVGVEVAATSEKPSTSRIPLSIACAAPTQTGVSSPSRRAGSRRGRRARPRAGARRARACRARAGAGTRAAERARDRRAGVPLAPREDLDGGGRGGQRDQPAGHGVRLFQRLSQQHGAGEVGREHRRDEMRAAALVLLLRVGGIGVVGLVRGDRLVLDAVVGGQLAAAQGEQRGRHRRRRGGRVARHPAGTAAHERARQGRAGGHREMTLGDSIGSFASGRPCLTERDHRERLAEPRQPAHAGHAVEHRHARLGAGRDLHVAGAGAHGGGPVRGTVDEQAVAQGHPAEAELSFGHGHDFEEPPGEVVEELAAKPRSRTSMRSSLACISGQVSYRVWWRWGKKRGDAVREGGAEPAAVGEAGSTVGTAGAGVRSPTQAAIASISGAATGSGCSSRLGELDVDVAVEDLGDAPAGDVLAHAGGTRHRRAAPRGPG